MAGDNGNEVGYQHGEDVTSSRNNSRGDAYGEGVPTAEGDNNLSRRKWILLIICFVVSLGIGGAFLVGLALVNLKFGAQIDGDVGAGTNGSDARNADSDIDSVASDDGANRKLLGLMNGVAIAQEALTESLSVGQLAQLFLLLLIGVQAFNFLPGNNVSDKFKLLKSLFLSPGSISDGASLSIALTRESS